jgi:prepilin-type processing-associated H-X9-DG protein
MHPYEMSQAAGMGVLPATPPPPNTVDPNDTPGAPYLAYNIHNGGANYLYADWHVKWMQWGQQVWNGLQPPTAYQTPLVGNGLQPCSGTTGE